MGEAHVTWLIDKSGNLRLKAFTQTIDRFDENQGLQETGIGISYKEDFNNFKDLKQRIRDRFTNKKRQKKRLAGCSSSKTETTAAASSAEETTTAAEETTTEAASESATENTGEETVVRIGGLKGPTTMEIGRASWRERV